MTVEPPLIEFWLEPSASKVRYKRYHTAEGLCHGPGRDSGIGDWRDKMPVGRSSTEQRIQAADFRSDRPIRPWRKQLACVLRIGAGHHAASKRIGSDEFFWTLIVPERSRR